MHKRFYLVTLRCQLFELDRLDQPSPMFISNLARLKKIKNKQSYYGISYNHLLLALTEVHVDAGRHFHSPFSIFIYPFNLHQYS